MALFNFVIKYRPGRSNGNADALSRQYLDRLTPGAEVPLASSWQHSKSLSDCLEVLRNEVMALPGRSFKDPAILQARDPGHWATLEDLAGG